MRILLLIGTFLVTSVSGFMAGNYIVDGQEPTFGALPLIQSAQLATDPDNGEVLSTNGTSNVWSSAGAGDITGGTSLGTGLTIFDSEISGILRFNSIAAGTNITLSTTSNDNTIVISSTASGGGSFPFSSDTNFGQVVYSTSTPTLWFKSGVFASSTSRFGYLTLNNWAIGTTTATVCKDASSCQYTTIQGAIDAGWTSIYVKNGTYSEQINLSTTKTQIVGESLNTIIQCNGVTQNPCVTADVDEFKISNLSIRETNGIWSGIGIDFSNAALGLIDSVRISNFSTSTYAHDTSNTTFYNKIRGNTFFNPKSCIDLGGTQPNANWSEFNRCRPAQVQGGGFGIYLSDTRGFTSIGDNFEGTTTSNGVTGIYVDATSREISFTNPWVEANTTGISVASGASRVTFQGGSITSNGTDISDSGTNTIFINTSDTGVLTNKYGNATTTSLGVTNLTSASCDVKSTSDGSLYCGTDATGGGGGSDPFMHGTFAGQSTSATTTLLHFTGSPFSTVASTTFSNFASSTQFTLGSYGSNVGIYLTDDADGALTVQGIGNNANESLTWNFDDTANEIDVTSATGVTDIDFNAIDLVGDVFQHTLGGILTLGNTDTTGHFVFTSGQTLNSSSGTDIFARIAPTVNQTGTANTNVLEIDATLTAVGSGFQNLLALQAGDVDKFVVSTAGVASTTALTVSSLNAANCDVKSSTSGVLSCGTDSEGAGGALSGGSLNALTYWTSETAVAATSSLPLYVGALFATSTSISSYFAGNVGIASTTPWSGLSLGIGNGSSTVAITVAEHRPATSTSMTIDWKMGNNQNIRMGVANMTVAFSNYTDGMNLSLLVCNPNSTSGTLTFSTQVLWMASSTAPAKTMTANKCDAYSFKATMATSTLKIIGTLSPNF